LLLIPPALKHKFDMFSKLVFRMKARLTTCRAISEDAATIDKIADLLMTMKTHATSTAILLPWFPGRDKKIIKQATSELYVMLYTCVETRRKEVPTTDAIDFLIGEGLDTNDIVQVWIRRLSRLVGTDWS
jgi:hypothetical protein